MSDVSEILNQALQLGEEERWEEMSEALTLALRDVPDDPYVLSWLGVAERGFSRGRIRQSTQSVHDNQLSLARFARRPRPSRLR